MLCPACGSGVTNVTETRVHSEGVRRRRRCLGCGLRFRSVERHDLSPRPRESARRFVLGLEVSDPLPGRRGSRAVRCGAAVAVVRGREAEVLYVASEAYHVPRNSEHAQT